MNHSYQELKQEYLKIKEEENAGMTAFHEWFNNAELRDSTPPPRDDIVLCSRNMALLYVSAGLCLCGEDKLIEEFKTHLFIVEAYARKVFVNSASIYVLLQIALCDTALSVSNYLELFVPDLIINQKTNETEEFVNYVIKISNRLLKTNYRWYGKALIESSIKALQSEKFFLTPNKEECIGILAEELQKYNCD